jgi:flap endonuclease-1
MGIKDMNKFLRDVCPQVFEEIHISEYSFKKIAIDVSLYLCKFKSIMGDDWLSAFLNLVACLRKNEVHCVFIYDTSSPPEKDQEKKERAEQRAKTEEKVCKLEDALDTYHKTQEVDPILIELYEKNKSKYEKEHQPLLTNKVEKVNVNMYIVEAIIKKMRSNVLEISPEDFAKTRVLFDILKVPYLLAPCEAETMCADLCKRGIVDAVLTEDTDVLAYECPIFLSKINTNGTCMRIKYDEVLEALELTKEAFLDMCIMFSCDYNKNIPKVGCKGSYKYIKEYESIEAIQANTTLDISILNHIRVRELFKDYTRSTLTKIPFCGSPDFNKLTEFVFKNNIKHNVETLKKSFIDSSSIVFVDDI